MAKKAIPISELPVISKLTDSAISPDLFNTGAIILIDKPLEWSSFHVVKYVRNRIPPKKVGHAGTLDPLATGLLVLCSGKATKSISQIQDQQKTYIAEIRFGSSTPSYDAATEADHKAGWKHITQTEIDEILEKQFTGVISQIPPIYSAIKIKGERLYKLARRGEDVEIKARNVHIYSCEIVHCELPDITIKVRCGKGTYIRSLAHDLGLALNSRAHLSGLRRTVIGSFDVVHAFTPEEFNIFSDSLTDD
jgi:tRNA pseudouridine55 synthase